MSTDIKVTSARAFVRSLNILLKFARLYGFDHPRTNEQFQAAWTELRGAMPTAATAGLLLGAVGDKLLVDGMPIGSSQAERSFAQLLGSAGIASLFFSREVTEDDLQRLARSFPSGRAKPAEIAAQIKGALEGSAGIRMNEIRFVAEDSSLSEVRTAAQLTAQTLGAGAEELKSWLTDPQKLLQLIAAAQGTEAGGGGEGTGHGGSGSSGGTGGGGSGTGGTGLSSGGSGSGVGGSLAVRGSSAPRGGSGGSTALFGVGEEDLVNVLKALTRIGSQMHGEAAGVGTATAVTQEISNLPANNRDLLRQALAGLAAQGDALRPDRAMLANLAEHLAIRFALDRYERGEVKVNAVRQMLERMNKEIDALRSILNEHEEKMAEAGLQVDSHTELMDRQFWASVPDTGKRSVLLSGEAWCIPARNIRSYLQELIERGDALLAGQILARYSACINSEDAEARRRAAMGLGELADLYASDNRILINAIRQTGMQLTCERDTELQTLVNATFVRLSQEAAARHCYIALQQVLTSLEAVDNQRPATALAVRPRLGIEERLPEFLDEAIREDHFPEGLPEVLRLMPEVAITQIEARFHRAGHRVSNDRLCELARAVGPEVTVRLNETLRVGPPVVAVEAAKLLSRLDPAAVEQWLPPRLPEWPLGAQDRLLRVLAAAGAPQRGMLFLALYSALDPMIRALAIEEMGMSGDEAVVQRLLQLLETDSAEPGSEFLRLKTMEALGRLRAVSAAPMLQRIAEERRAWRWAWPEELRIVAFQSMQKIDPAWAQEKESRLGFDSWQTIQAAVDPTPEVPWYRQRRYQRIRLDEPITALVTSETEEYRLEIKGINLSGGTGRCEHHVLPGTRVSLKISLGLRAIRIDALMRDVRTTGVSFEILSMDLEDRNRLRKLLAGQTQAAVMTPA
jgi:hypothetical protein